MSNDLRPTNRILLALLALTLATATSRAETIVMKDGSLREGTIVEQNDDTVRLRVNKDGMTATLSIPKSDIDHIDQTRKEPAPPSPATPVPAAPQVPAPTPAPAAIAPAVATTHPTATGSLHTHGFITELAATSVGLGPDSPLRLPPDLAADWDNAVKTDKAGNGATTLDALRTLEEAFHAQPDGLQRLDGLSQHERNETFGQWMARVHLDVMTAKLHGPSFDLKDVRDIEKPALIGMLKEKTDPALEPLKSYFPPVDEKTGKPGPMLASQLSGISVSNALEVKQQVQFAMAILLAQIKLDPTMPAVDRQLLSSQLAPLQRIQSRASDFEPAARLAQQKADREKALADEKAKRDADKQKAATQPAH